MPVNNLLPLSSRSTFPYLLCNNGQEPFCISALVSTIFSFLRKWWRALLEEGDSQHDWEHISQGPAPATCTAPQWPHRPSLAITFLWPSQYRHHILQASHQCPSSLCNLSSAAHQEPQISSGPGKPAHSPPSSRLQLYLLHRGLNPGLKEGGILTSLPFPGYSPSTLEYPLEFFYILGLLFFIA